VLIGNYHRVEMQAESLAALTFATMAASVASDRHDPALVPTDRYMGCVIAGAEEHGLPAAYIAYLRGVPVCRETAGVRELIDAVFRELRPRSQGGPYGFCERSIFRRKHLVCPRGKSSSVAKTS
jgi:hypothetical protein